MVEMEAFDKVHLVRLLGYDKPLDIEHERLAEMCREADLKAQAKQPVETQDNIESAKERQRKSDRV